MCALMWKYCITPLRQPNGSEKPCGNRVLRFVDVQRDDQCYRCYEIVEDFGGFDAGYHYTDPNNGGVPK